MRKIFLISMLSLFIFCSTGYAELIDNGDGTVTDTKTELVWQKAEAGLMPWKEAIAYCDTLVLAGHSDWRLPDLSELKSLSDSIDDNPGINKAVFPDMNLGYYSSTTYSDNTSYAMVVSFGISAPGAADKNRSYYVRAVRGGQ